MNEIYRKKNKKEVVLTHIFGVTLFISGAIKALGDDMAKRGFANKEKLLTMLAKRVLIAVEIWGSRTFIEYFAAKYPPHGCTYCGHKPCQCGAEKTQAAVLVKPNENVDIWSLSDWQKHLNDVYGEANLRRFSLHDMVILTMAEYHEVMMALEHRSVVYETTELNDDIRKVAVEETADLFARILSLANYVGVPLEESLQKRYGDGCPICHHKECQCPPFWGDYKTYERFLLSSLEGE